MKERILSKLSSPVAWGVLIVYVVGLVAMYNVEMSQTVEYILKGLITVCIAFGVLNNPDNKEGF